MNEDLKFRLTDYCKLNASDKQAVNKVLTEFMFKSISNQNDLYVVITLEPIENDEDDTAYVTYDGEVFDIVVDNRMPTGMVLDYVLHELAHVNSWFHYEEDDHGDEFGKSYAYLYREYLKLYDKYLCK